MNYAHMLNGIILKSELSLRQVSKRCADLDLSITPSYISQLKNGKLPPPSPEVSLILAEACNSKEASKLVFQGYLEKAPEVIKEYMLASSQLNKVMLEALYKKQTDGKMAEEAKDYLNQLDILSTIDLSSKYIKDGKIELKSDLVKEITLGSGGPVRENGEQISMFLGDTSMAPTIPIHSHISIMPTKTELLKNRDIIAFYPYGKRQPILRRLYFEKNNILLLPDDRISEIYILENLDELNYLGKVVSYRIDL